MSGSKRAVGYQAVGVHWAPMSQVSTGFEDGIASARAFVYTQIQLFVLVGVVFLGCPKKRALLFRVYISAETPTQFGVRTGGQPPRWHSSSRLCPKTWQ